MQRAIFVRMNRLLITAAAVALGGCTGSGSQQAELPDSAMTQVQADPVTTPQPAPADTVSPAPTRAPAQGTPARPSQAEPVLRQPPPPRDTRPSIPWPPDTI